MTSPLHDPRLQQIHTWLATLPTTLRLHPQTLTPVSGDASFRRYFRVQTDDESVIVMDAPPPREDTKPFLHIAGLLQAANVHVPSIIAQDTDQGLLLLSDLGRQNYTERIRDGLDDTTLQALYHDALAALVRLQTANASSLAIYDATRLRAELDLFTEWYVGVHHQTTLDENTTLALEKIFWLLSDANSQQATVLVHRDYHSPNLMVCTESGANPGVIDFQDALAGPITYDLASLVTDARTTWEEAQQLDWAIRYWDMARQAGLPVDADFAVFHRAYEWMSLQRNLRILGIFARLNHRDNKPAYLANLPR